MFTPILQQICEALGNRYLIRRWFNFMQVCHIDVQVWFHRSTKSGFYFFTRDSYKKMNEISERCLKDINNNSTEFKTCVCILCTYSSSKLLGKHNVLLLMKFEDFILYWICFCVKNLFIEAIINRFKKKYRVSTKLWPPYTSLDLNSLRL